MNDLTWWRSLRRIPGVLCLVAALSLATNFLFFSRFHDYYSDDSASYVESAANIVAGHGFTDREGYPEVIRTPGYPLLLAPFLWAHLDLKYMVVLQHLLSVLIAVAAAAFAFQVSGSRVQSLIAGMMLGIDLPTLDAANTILTEAVFTAILMMIVWMLWIAPQKPEKSTWLLLAAGFLSGASALVRPASLFYCVPIVVYLLLVCRRFRLRAALSFVLAFACLPLLWTARNYHKTGYWIFSPVSAWNLLTYHAGGVLAIDDPGDFQTNMDKRRDQLVKQVCTDAKDLYGSECPALLIPQPSVPQKSQYYARLGAKIILEHPISYARLTVRGILVMMLGGDADRLAKITGSRPQSAAKILLIYTVPILCVAMVGAGKLWKTNRPFFYLTSLTIVYFVVIAAGGEAYSRFRVPVTPFYVILAAAGAATIVNIFRPHRNSV